MKKTQTKNKLDFIAIASHQLRTPLTLMKGYLSMIINGDFGKITKTEVTKALINVFQANEDLIHLVENLLAKARLETSDLKITRQSVDLKKIIESLIGLLASKAKTKGLSLKLTISKGSYRLQADGILLRQVFVNLIDNALTHTKDGHVNVNLRRTKKNIIITISDTGAALTTRKLKMLFSKFERPHLSLSKQGFGYGVYIAGLIVKAHNGILSAHVAKPKGLKVICELPVME